MRHHTPRLAAAGLVLLTTLAGCGTPPWATAESSPDVSASPSKAASASTTPKPSTTPRPSATATTAPARNDLATGSAKRTLEAGGLELKVNYWSTLDMGSWTPEANKPLNLSASAKFVDGSKQDIFLSQASVAIEVQGPDGVLDAPKTLTDEAKVAPGFAVKSPSAYLPVFTIGALDKTATSVTLTITYELLGQTAPDAKTYTKQTASDTLVIALA